ALNNELVRLREEEAAEVRRILRALTEQLARRQNELERATRILGELDAVFARARYAREFRCTIPALDTDHALRLTAVRHPMLEAALRGTQPQADRASSNGAVPISFELDRAQHVLVISGPNAGGKTAALKTLGLAALAAQAGIPVPAEGARLPLFRRILADIGDEQSLVENLSTFSAHIRNLGQMAEEADLRSLVLLDELGAATSPEEGAALGIALLEHFRARGALTVATTHHERLKAYAASTPGALNAAVEFDEVNLRPTYRLRVGVPGVSSGLEMAARLGLRGDIVEAARSRLSAEASETAALIRSLHQTQQQLEQLQQEVRGELERLQRERELLQSEWLKEQRRKLGELERSFEAMLAQYQKKMRAVVEQVVETGKTGKRRALLERSAARQLSQVHAELGRELAKVVHEHLPEAESAGPVPVSKRVEAERLVPGAQVKLRGIARRGVVLSRQGKDQVEVQMGSLRMRVRVADVEEITGAPGKHSTKTGVKAGLTAETPSTQSGAELHVRGLKVEEALQVVDKFLDQAALAGQKEVRIVHGIGKGVLKKALAEYLADHPHVESTREAPREQG
ncbi:MAG: Smr/MutS family protein, partial [Terriglobia bacterium]